MAEARFLYRVVLQMFLVLDSFSSLNIRVLSHGRARSFTNENFVLRQVVVWLVPLGAPKSGFYMFAWLIVMGSVFGDWV